MTARSNPPAVKIICPAVKTYDREALKRGAAEYDALPKDSVIKAMIRDYQKSRDEARACRGMQ